MHAQQTGHSRKSLGFSLLEMGIVIVVVGLLAGGILVGQNLIRSAEVQSLLSDFQRYQAATARFRAQFASLPGDMPDATMHWSGDAHNGDGDGFIDDLDPVGTGYSEPVQFWKHLQLAGELDISMTGRQDPCANCVMLTANENAPGSSITNGIWVPGYDATNALTGTPTVAASNFMVFTGDRNTGGYAPPQPILTPAEAFSIDRKVDDSVATTGEVIGTPTANCASGDEYQATLDTKECALIFLNAF